MYILKTVTCFESRTWLVRRGAGRLLLVLPPPLLSNIYSFFFFCLYNNVHNSVYLLYYNILIYCIIKQFILIVNKTIVYKSVNLYGDSISKELPYTLNRYGGLLRTTVDIDHSWVSIIEPARDKACGRERHVRGDLRRTSPWHMPYR